MQSVVQLSIDYASFLQPTSGQILVEDICDYAPAYACIVEAIHAGRPLTVIVRHRTCAAWLQIAQKKYGPERIHIVTISHRGHLAESWGVEIPRWITDETIARSKLLEVPLRAQPGQRFEDVVLETFYSPYLTFDRLPLAYLADLLNSYDASRWAKAEQRPLVKEILVRRFQFWLETATSTGERLLVEGLQRDPQALARRLAQVKVLAGYPTEVGQRVLGAEYDALASLNLDLSSLPLREADLTETVDQIRVHLNTLAQALSPDEALKQLLEQVSGYLVAEYEGFQELLKSGEASVDEDLVQQIRAKFAPAHDRLEQELADLDLMITPPRPPYPNPDGAWNIDEWLDWAVQHYLPYRFWLEEIGRHDEEIANYADAFAEWLYEHYGQLRLNYPRMVYRGLLNLPDRLTTPAPVLFAVLDNLNYKFYPDLVRYLQGQGFFVEQTTPYLSMLPSCTEVSKKSLFVGQPEPFSGTAYEKPTLKAWEPPFKGRRIKYLPHIGALRSIKQREHDLYFLNYLPIDEALHEDEQQTGVPYSAKIRQLLQALAADIRKFAERLGADRDLTVIVISDHGSTRISADAPNPIDQKFYSSRVQNKHHRYVTISDKELAALPDNVRFECFIFERKLFDLPTNFLAARSTYRFVEPGEGIYVHGGLWPEETIVPLAIFSPKVVTPKPLTIRLLADEFRYDVKSVVRLELVNVNQYACQELHIDILNTAVEAASTTIGDLAALSQAEAPVEARIRRRGEELTALQVRINYQFLGRPQRQDAELPITMKRMMTTTFDLDEL